MGNIERFVTCHLTWAEFSGRGDILHMSSLPGIISTVSESGGVISSGSSSTLGWRETLIHINHFQPDVQHLIFSFTIKK